MIENPITRGVYRLRARNLDIGVWNGHGWIGIREKFGDRFLDESEVPGRTAFAEEFICMLPDDIETRSHMPTICETCREEIDFDADRGPTAQDRWGHAASDHVVRPIGRTYQPLFDFLDNLQ